MGKEFKKVGGRKMALIKCSECGKKVSDTASECIHCGCPIQRKVTCSECGAEVIVKDGVCKECGHRLDAKTKITNSNIDLSKFMNKNTIIIGGAAILAIVLIAIVLGQSSKFSLEKVYEEIGCTSTYCTLADDGSYIEIDTNPLDLDDYSSSTAAEYVKEANKACGFNDSLYSKMGKTRALDGTLTDENKNVKVSWTYHPDHGLNVVYTLK